MEKLLTQHKVQEEKQDKNAEISFLLSIYFYSSGYRLTAPQVHTTVSVSEVVFPHSHLLNFVNLQACNNNSSGNSVVHYNQGHSTFFSSYILKFLEPT